MTDIELLFDWIHLCIVILRYKIHYLYLHVVTIEAFQSHTPQAKLTSMYALCPKSLFYGL